MQLAVDAEDIEDGHEVDHLDHDDHEPHYLYPHCCNGDTCTKSRHRLPITIPEIKHWLPAMAASTAKCRV